MELIKIDGLPAAVISIRELIGTLLGTWILAIVMFSFLVVKVPQIPLVQWLIRFKSRKLDWLKEHSGGATDETYCKRAIEDIRDATIFERATGIHAEKNWRKGLVELHDQTGVSWVTVRRARKYMSLGLDEKVHLRDLHFRDSLEAWLNAIMAWMFLLFATVMFISLLMLELQIAEVLTGILLIALLSGCAFGAAIQNAPKYAATVIRKRIDEIHARTHLDNSDSSSRRD